MTVGLVSFGTRVDRGWGVRVRSLVQMISSFSPIEIFHIENDVDKPAANLRLPLIIDGIRNSHSTHIEVAEGVRTKISRLFNYYRNDRVKISTTLLDRIETIGAFQVESLDLFFLANSLNKHKKPVILDEHNVYWNLLKYGMFDSPFFRGAVGRNRFIRKTAAIWLLDRARRFELRCLDAADAVFVTSEVDKSHIVCAYPELEKKITVIPNCIDATEYPVERFRKTNEETRNIVFVGRLDYSPNIDAVQTIIKEIAPRFDQRIRFQIVGGPIPNVECGRENVDFLGIVPDIKEVLRNADVCIAPLRFGSGTRIKILEYLAMCKPVVSTSIGCEGLMVENRRNIMIADDTGAFVRAIRELIENRDLAISIGKEGRRLVEEKYDWRIYAPIVRSVYRSLGVLEQ
ncbi:MAG: glycosyltransferase family 4 protein [Methanomassiliicoccales archaeon]|jgi:glycosyltransferase involved in cell wall biosynthesis|nr:glycosyltransferase family 4 protein [Methanomassiliicoccales archaeon]